MIWLTILLKLWSMGRKCGIFRTQHFGIFCYNVDQCCTHICGWIWQRADKSLDPPGRKQAPKHVRDARDFNNIETRAVIKIFSLQGKAPKEIHAILTETSACFLPGRAKNLSVPLYLCHSECQCELTLILLTWRIWRASNNASRWRMRFNLALKGLIITV